MNFFFKSNILFIIFIIGIYMIHTFENIINLNGNKIKNKINIYMYFNKFIILINLTYLINITVKYLFLMVNLLIYF